MRDVRAAFLLFLFAFSNFQVSVTTLNLSDYPWLVPGAYANYSTTPLSFGAPAFILSDGTMLQSYQCDCWANATLGWVVSSRVSGMVRLHVNYEIKGSELDSKNGSMVTFDYKTSVDLAVDVSTGMTRNNNKVEGIMAFWSTPLPAVGDNITFSTGFVGGVPRNISHVMRPEDICRGDCGLSSQPVVNGAKYTDHLDYYMPQNTVFVRPLDGTINGHNYTTEISKNQLPYFPLDPWPQYDYYTGLALGLSVPDTTPSVSICGLNGNITANCRVADYSTTLAEYFRTYAAIVWLRSTNISLLPESPVSSGNPELEWIPVVVAGAVAIAIGSLAYRLMRRGNLKSKVEEQKAGMANFTTRRDRARTLWN